MKYLLDSNIFIRAHRETHPLDIHITFWEKLKLFLKRDDIFSIDKVKDELFYFEDDLKSWCKANIDKAFWKNSAISIAEYAKIQNWATSKNYTSGALSDFADFKNADPFLVSFACYQKQLGQNFTIITHEVSSPGSKKSIKIPDICQEYSIKCENLNYLFRELNISF